MDDLLVGVVVGHAKADGTKTVALVAEGPAETVNHFKARLYEFFSLCDAVTVTESEEEAPLCATTGKVM